MNNYSQPRLALQPSLQSLFPSLRHGASDGCAGLQTDDSYPSHTEYITKPPASAAAQNFQYLLGSFFFSICKMLKLYLLWTARATLLMSWSDCPQRTIIVGILLHSTTNSDRKETDLSVLKKHNLQSIINIKHPHPPQIFTPSI